MTIRRAAWIATWACIAALASGCGGDERATEPPTAVPGTRTGDPAMAVSPDGTAHAAWAQRHPDGTRSVMASARPAGGEWSAPEQVAPRRVWETGRVRIAVNARGDRLVSYMLADRGRRLAQAVLGPAGDGWGRPVTVSRASGDIVEPFPVLADDGRAAVASVTAGRDGTSVAIAARPAGGRWRDPVPVRAEDGMWSAAQAPFASGGEACMLSAWRPVDATLAAPGGLRVHCVGAGGVPRRVAPPRKTGPSRVRSVAAHRVGDGAVAVWSEGRGDAAPWSLVASRRGPSGGWSAPVVLDRSPYLLGLPAVGEGDAGAAVIAWSRWTRPGQGAEVRAATWRPRDAPAPETVGGFRTGGAPEGFGAVDRLPAPGRLVVASGPRPAVIWARGGFPAEALEGPLRAVTHDGDGSWRSVALPPAGDHVRPLAAATDGDALVLAWARYAEATGGDAEPVSVTVPLDPAG